MRKIKFRAWDNEEKNFIYFDALNGILSKCDETYLRRCVGRFEQFTGLYDKNGKEIYEGDVLKDKYEYRGTAHWYGSGFEFINTSGMMENGNDWEVIGNIHENPELLEVAK